MRRGVQYLSGIKLVAPDVARPAFEAYVRGSSDYFYAMSGHKRPRTFFLVDPRPLFGQAPKAEQ